MTSDLDLNWRLPTKEGVVWRLATIDDMPMIEEIWREMDRRLGEKQDRPDLFRMPVVLTLVAEDENGTILSAIYGEAVVDWTMIGTDRKAARAVDALFPTLHFFLFERTIRVARVLVPMRLRRHMKRLLPGMREITESFAQFACTIRR